MLRVFKIAVNRRGDHPGIRLVPFPTNLNPQDGRPNLRDDDESVPGDFLTESVNGLDYVHGRRQHAPWQVGFELLAYGRWIKQQTRLDKPVAATLQMRDVRREVALGPMTERGLSCVTVDT